MKDIYQEITDRMLAELRKGVVPWQKPWECSQHANFITRKPYRGINMLTTGTSEFGCPFWVTFKQAIDLKGTIKRGQKATPIIFWKFLGIHDDKGTPVLTPNGHQKVIPLVRYSNVFNLLQTEGIEIPIKEEFRPAEPLVRAQAIVDAAKVCPIQHDDFSAFYNLTQDKISMPPSGSFKTPEKYYHTLFHELTHATGHPTRLDRDLSGGRGSPKYAKEELIAEMSACFLSNQAGTMSDGIFENSASYIDDWLKALNDDKTMVVSAASAAQKANSFILGEQMDQTQAVTTTEQPIVTQGLSPAVRLLTESKLRTEQAQGLSPSLS